MNEDETETGTVGPLPTLRHAQADRAILALASGQHGVVTREQILAAGISSGILERRLRSRLLRPLHRGVYLAGPVQSAEARAMAAALACGTGSVVGHWSAASLAELRPAEPASIIDVILASGDRRRPGIRTHRNPGLHPDEVMAHRGIPVTTPARTLLDLAAAADTRDLERLVVEALGKRLTSHAELTKMAVRHAKRPGAARLAELIESRNGRHTRSEAERRFLSLIRKARIAAPEVNVQVAGLEVDFFWRTERLVIEVDGRAFHSTTGRFERDRRRDLELAAAGLRVIRVTWRQLTHESEALLVRLARSIGAAAE